MRSGFAFSISVHALILFLLITQLPFLRPKPTEEPPMISVELVQEARHTTTTRVSQANKVEKQPQDETPPAPAKPQTAPEPTPQPEQQPKQVELEPAPTLTPVDTAPPPELEAPPEEVLKQPMAPPPKIPTPNEQAPVLDAPPKVVLKQPMAPPPKIAMMDEHAPKLVVPEANIKPHLAPAPALSTPQVEEKVAALVPPAKIDLKRPPGKQPPKSIDSVLNHVLNNAALKNLEKDDRQDSDQDTPPQPARTAHKASGAQAPVSQELTQSELGAVQDQLDGCMTWPDGASAKPNLLIQLDVTINADRTVATARVVNEESIGNDPVYAASVRAALRAVRSPHCTPLDLPPEKYQAWQSMTVNLRPPH